MSVRTETTTSSDKGLVRLQLHSKDPIALQFSTFGARLTSLLEDNANLNAQLVQNAERARAALLEREQSITVLQSQVEGGSAPLEVSQSENLEREIEQMQRKIKKLVLKTKTALERKVATKKYNVGVLQSRLEAEMVKVRQVQQEAAELSGKEDGSKKIISENTTKLAAIREEKRKCIEEIRNVIRRIIFLVQAEQKELLDHIPPDYKGPVTPESLKNTHIRNHLRHQHEWLQTFESRANCFLQYEFNC